MKKHIVTVLCTLMVIGMLGGCGSSSGPITADEETDQITAALDTDKFVAEYAKDAAGSIDYGKLKEAFQKKNSTYGDSNGNGDNPFDNGGKTDKKEDEPKDSADKPQSENSSDSKDFVFPYSDSELVEETAVKALSDEDLRIAINEIYARHGRKFKSEELQTYFEAKSWYSPRYEAEDFDKKQDSLLNDVEKTNIRILAAEREARKK